MRYASTLPPPPSSLTFTQGFEKVEDEWSKWRLTEKAVLDGILATTRVRHKSTNKLHARKPNPTRRKSGAKGGRANAEKVKKKKRLEVQAYSTTPEAVDFGGLLPASYTDFDPDALFCTDQTYPFDPSATLSQPSTLVLEWGPFEDAEMWFAACDGFSPQLSCQELEEVQCHIEVSLPRTPRK